MAARAGAPLLPSVLACILCNNWEAKGQLSCFPHAQWYSERMQELRRRILEEREKTSDNVVPSAFVTFKCGP